MKSYHDFNGEREYYMRGDKVYRRGDPEPVKFNDPLDRPYAPTKVGQHLWHCGRCDNQWAALEQRPCVTCGDWREDDDDGIVVHVSEHEFFSDFEMPKLPDGAIVHETSPSKYLDRAPEVGDTVEFREPRPGYAKNLPDQNTITHAECGEYSGTLYVQINSRQSFAYAADFRVLAPRQPTPSEDATELKIDDWVKVDAEFAAVIDKIHKSNYQIYYPSDDYFTWHDGKDFTKLSPSDGYEVESGKVVRGAFEGVGKREHLWALEFDGEVYTSPFGSKYNHYLSKPSGRNDIIHKGPLIRRCVNDPRND